MNDRALTDYWIRHHNEKYFKYLLNYDEPRYELKTFFLNSFYLFKTFGKDWNAYLEKYQDLFKRDPASDYYKYRDPLVTDRNKKRLNALEWTNLFEIILHVGYPYNESAKENLLKYAKEFLLKGMESPDSDWIDFMLSSGVANLPEDFKFLIDWLPSQIREYIKSKNCTPHQYIAYLHALRIYDNQNELKEEILEKLINWIKSPSGNSRGQILVWARLITRLDCLPEIMEKDIQKKIKDNFLRTLSEVHNVNWSYSPMILEAFYHCSNQQKRSEILFQVGEKITPSSFFKFHELFPFINPQDEAPEINDEVLSIKEKCKSHTSLEECHDCMKNKKGDCWIRILSKLTHTTPKLHSGYEVGDIVIYTLQQGTYVVIKAENIRTTQSGGDTLFRQCVSLFSNDHALVLYLNPHETAPFLIEHIRKAASDSTKNPRFEVIAHKYIRQIYKKYKLESY